MRIIYLSLTIFVLIILLLTIYFYTPTTIEEEKSFFCGNAIIEEKQREDAITKYGIDTNNGKRLFKQNCAVCHNLDNNKIVGPGLENVISRVPNEQWLFDYISNSDSLFKQKDPYSLKLRAEYPDVRMTNFTDLSAKDINEIIAFIKYAPTRIMY